MSAGIVMAIAFSVAMMPVVVWALHEARRQYNESKENRHGG